MNSDDTGRHLLQWCVPGQPVLQKRHRHTFRGTTWDPSSQTKEVFLQQSMQLLPKGMAPLACPLRMCLDFEFARPKSHLRKKGGLTKRAPKHHCQTPDADNLAKMIMDSLNGHVYVDDKQVCELNVRKRWTMQPQGCTRVTLYDASCCSCEDACAPEHPAKGIPAETPGGTTSSNPPM